MKRRAHLGYLLAIMSTLWVGTPPAAAGPTLPERTPANPPEKPPENPPILLELFSSEGCSSCPPADRLLSELAQKGLATNSQSPSPRIIALEWHVDYWNYLGWADPFSSAQHTERQQQYAQALSAGRVYTPQLVVDGRFEGVGSNEARVRALIAQSAQTPKVRIQIERHGTQLDVQVPEVPKSAQGSELWLALTESDLVTVVPRGENAGKTLPHAPIVRSLRRIGRADSGPLHVTTQLAFPTAWKRNKLSAVVFLQRPALGAVLGVAELALAGL